MEKCYQCGKQTEWLAPDSRCRECTHLTPEEIRGDVPEETQPYDRDTVAAGIANVHAKAGDRNGCAAYRNACRFYRLSDEDAIELDIEVGSMCLSARANKGPATPSNSHSDDELETIIEQQKARIEELEAALKRSPDTSGTLCVGEDTADEAGCPL